jgi:hypothetical protein
MPGFLYQTIEAGERARQLIDRKREGVRDGAMVFHRVHVGRVFFHCIPH